MPRRAALRPRPAGAGRRAPARRRGPRAHADRDRQPRRSSSSCAAETGSFARAGLVAAAFGLGDRAARRRCWAGSSTATGTRGSCSRWRPRTRPSLGALVALGLAGAPTGVLVACAWSAGVSIPPVGSVVRPLLARPAAARTRTCCPPPTRSTASPSSSSSSPGRCSPRRSWSSPRRRSRCWSRAAFVVVGTLVLIASPAVARLAPGRRDARAPPARRAGLAGHAHDRRRDGARRLRPRAPRR